MLDNISWIGVLVAGTAGAIIGALWFGPKTFFPVWWRLMGNAPGTAAKPGGDLSMPVVFGSTIAAQLVGAATMAVVINMAIASGVASPFGIFEGIVVGTLVGIGLVAASSLGHRLFGGHGFAVWALEVGNDIVGLAAMGGILAYFQAP